VLLEEVAAVGTGGTAGWGGEYAGLAYSNRPARAKVYVCLEGDQLVRDLLILSKEVAEERPALLFIILFLNLADAEISGKIRGWLRVGLPAGR
jgi:hypothetical protein